MADVFVSYSRSDKEFVGRLHQTLTEHQKDVWVDWEDIPPTAAWLDEILSAIAGAQSVIFVLSPASIASTTCRQELEHAVQLNKRLIPVVCRTVNPEALPEAIRGLQWIDFENGRDYATVFGTLIKAIDTDLDWVRLHTELLQRAAEWDHKSHDTALLLRGVSLQEAETWLAQGPAKEPKPSSLQTRLIAESRKYATAVQRRVIWAVSAALIIAIGLAIFAFMQRSRAEEQRKIAEERLGLAVARDLAAQARIVQGQEARLLPRSILLAIESMRRSPSLQADMVLRTGLRLLSRVDRTLVHQGGVNSIAFSPDGKSIASAGQDGTVRIWDIQSGRERLRVSQGKGASQVIFSPDGQLLATSGQFDPVVKVWNAAKGNELFTIKHDSGIGILDFSPDGRLLVTASGYSGFRRGNAAFLWDVQDRKQVAELDHQGSVTAAHFFPDGHRLATGSQDGTVRVWSINSGQERLRLRCGGQVLDIAVSRSAQRIAVATSNQVQVWNAQTGESIWKSPRQPADVAVVEFNADATRVATGGYDRTARVWVAATGHELARFEHDKAVFDLAFNSDGGYLATASADQTARVFDVASQTEIDRVSYRMPVFHIRLARNDRYIATASQDGTVKIWEPPWTKPRDLAHDGPISALAFSRSGRYVATASADAGADNTARVWDVTSRRELARVTHGSGVHAIAFSADDRHLATGSDDNTARVVDLQTGKEIRRFQHGGDVRDVSFSPNGRILATASFDKTSRAFDLQTGRELGRMSYGQTVWSVAFSPDGRWIASADASGELKIWRPGSSFANVTRSTGGWIEKVTFSRDSQRLISAGDGAVVWDAQRGTELVRVCQKCRVVTVGFAPDGETFATGGLDGHARVWRTRDGSLLADFRHEATVMSLVFSPDGQYLGTGGEDKLGHVWEIASGREVVRYVHTDWVNAVAFSPDGHFFATGSSDHTARLEPWRPNDLLLEACARIGRNLTLDEWRQYLPNEIYRSTCPGLPH